MNQEKENRANSASDLPDSPHDEARMQAEVVTIELPDVSDIPGQENIKPAPLGELADTTMSSAGEEGAGLFDDEDDNLAEERTPVNMGTDADVSQEEKKALRTAAEDMPGGDDEGLRKAALDNADDEGTPLNEAGFGVDVTGTDLDVPGSEADDENEEIGEEDEENNQYSRGGVNNDNMTEGTP